jgi:hypothetical protein
MIAKSQVVLNVSLSECNSKGEFLIRNILQNKTKLPKEFYPWTSPQTGILLGVFYEAYYDEKHPKGLSFPIIDGVGDLSTIVIQPGAKLERFSNLSRMFGDLPEINQKYKVYVFWNYYFRSIDGYENDSSGFFVIPKNCTKNGR